MSDTTITCPYCHQPFELTTAMSAGIEARLKSQFENQAAQRQSELDERERAVAASAAEVERSKATLDQEVANRLSAEKAKLAQSIGEKVRQDSAAKVSALEKDVDGLTAKLGEAREREQALGQRERELEDRAKTIDREVQLTLLCHLTRVVENLRA